MCACRRARQSLALKRAQASRASIDRASALETANEMAAVTTAEAADK